MDSVRWLMIDLPQIYLRDLSREGLDGGAWTQLQLTGGLFWHCRVWAAIIDFETAVESINPRIVLRADRAEHF